jgi:cell division protein FtsL
VTRLNLLLLVALLGSCVFLVRVAYDARRLFTELDKAQAQERQLESDFERLKAEKQSQATPSRVEAVARNQLGMRTATPAVTNYVTFGRGNAAPATAASEAAR